MAVQIPLFQPPTNWTPPKLSELPSWKGATGVGLDCETSDPQLKKLGIGVRRDGRVVGVSFALEFPGQPLRGYYLPWGHEGGDNLPKGHVIQYLRDQAAVFRGEIIGANLPYDLDYLLEEGIEYQPSFYRDVQVAEPLLDENQFSYSLNAVAGYNGFEGKDETLLEEAAKRFGVHPKAELWKLPARFVGPYAEIDAVLPVRILRHQEERIRQQAAEDPYDDGRFWDLYNLESRLLPVLLKMRRRGVLIDLDHVDKVEARCFAEEEDQLKEFSRQAGRHVGVEDINRPAVIGPAIQEATGISLPLTPTGKISIKKEYLEPHKNLPIVATFLKARRYNKLRTTFVESIRNHQVNGRIHCTFRQLRGESSSGDLAGVGPGRLSSSDPNLQQQPARDEEIGDFWRQIYKPDPGGEWACLDFSQQEPRWVVHFAEVKRLPRASDAAEKYRTDPSTDNHSMMAELINGDEFDKRWLDDPEGPHFKIAKKIRGDAKTIFLGKMYAMGGAKYCRSVGLPTEWIENRAGKMVEIAGPEGQAALDRFERGLPYVKMLANLVEEAAKARGYVRTVLGRRCRFERGKHGKFEFTYRALNRLIQGSSADQTKKAMVTADDAGIELQLQVHDELDLTIYDRSTAAHLSEIMQNAVTANVPFKVDIETGPSWGEIK